VPDPLLAAVLCALAGVRRGDRVRALGVAPVVTSALLSAAEARAVAEGKADVVVTGGAYEVPAALDALAPGARLVSVAADAAAAARVAGAAGLVRLHVVPISGGVAWSAVRATEGGAAGGRDIVRR
jgi:hypothetical protein